MTDSAPAGPVGAGSLRRGTVQIAAGVAFFAASTYVFTAFGTRTMGPERFSDFSVFWGLVYGIGLGAALPLEQETSRRVSVSVAHGRAEDYGGVLTACVAAAVVVCGIAVLVALPLCLVLTDALGQGLWLWLSTSAALAGLAVAYVTRGGLSGSRHFGRYAVQAGAEGGSRIILAAVLAGLVVQSALAWELAVGAALLLAVAVSAPPLLPALARARTAPRRPPLRPVLASLGALVVASAIAQSLVNFGPVAVRLLAGPDERGLAGSFLAAALVARAPTFAFAAVQAVLVPRLVEALTLGRTDLFRRLLLRILAATAALGAVAAAVCLAVGPQLLRILSGPAFRMGNLDVALLAVSTGLYLLTLVLQPAALTLEQHAWIALAWVGAGLVFVTLCFLPLPAVRAVNLAMVGSLAVAVLALAVLVVLGLRSQDRRLSGTPGRATDRGGSA